MKGTAEERRKYVRYPVDVQAWLTLGQTEIGVRLVNFCDGGVLVALQSTELAPQEPGCIFKLSATADQDGAPIYVDVRACRKSNNELGLAFVGDASRLLSVLRRVANIKPTRSAISGAPGVRKMRSDVWEKMVAFVRRGFTGFFEDALLKASASLIDVPQIKNNPKKSDFALFTQGLLQKQGASVAADVKERICRGFEKLSKNDSEQTPHIVRPALNRLSVMQKDEFEVWLTINITTRTLESEVSTLFLQLHASIREVVAQNIDVSRNSMSPQNIAETLHFALQEAGCSHEQLSDLFPVVAKIIGPLLKGLYQQVLEFLSGEGVQTEWTLPNTNDPQRSKPVDKTSSPAAPGGKINDNNEPRATSHQDAYETLHSLFNLSTAVRSKTELFNVAEVGQEALDGALTTKSPAQITRNDLLKAIDLAGQYSTEEGWSEKTVREIIAADLTADSEAEKQEFAPEDEEAIEITERLFQALDDNPLLNTILKRLLDRLKLAVLKIVILDRSFLSNQDHPARQFMNQMGRLGQGMAIAPGIERHLEQFTERMVSEFNGEQNFFDDLLPEVNALVNRQESAFKKNRRRIERAEEAKQELSRARAVVANDIRNRLLNRRIPDLVLALLYKVGWRQRLVIDWIRTKGGDAYRKTLGILHLTARQLNNSAKLELSNDDDLSSSEASVNKKLLSMLKLEFRDAKQSQNENFLRDIDAVLNRKSKVVFTQVNEELFNEYEEAFVEIEVSASLSTASSAETSSQSDAPPQQDRQQRRLRKLKEGDWVVFCRPGEVERYLQLVWRNKNNYRFTYLDDKGLQDTELMEDALAKDLRQGHLRVMENTDRPLMDQGIQSVVQSFYEDLAAQAQKDSLTGLLSRYEFEKQLERYHSEALSEQTSKHLLYIDLDRFRVINTTQGHAWGDRILKDVAASLTEQFGTTAVLGRLGGNEFGALLLNRSPAEAEEAAQDFSGSICRRRYDIKEGALRVTVSIGLAHLDSQSETPDIALRQAGIACMAAKEVGGNRLQVYQDKNEDQARQSARLNWLSKLDSDLDRLLDLRCQPIVSLKDAETPKHYEVLLGVRGDDGRLQGPAALIETAEQYNRMTRVDRWVVKRVFKWMEDNESSLGSLKRLSINLSGNSINDESVLQFIIDTISSSKVNPSKVCFEITETSAIGSLSNAGDFIQEVKQHGCRFSLDDFGTGLSSYAYLQSLPVDYVKIDGVFVRNIVNSVKDQALVKSITELAQFMGMKTIAEFVEDEESYDLVRMLGVDYVQGYYVGKPTLLSDLSLVENEYP